MEVLIFGFFCFVAGLLARPWVQKQITGQWPPDPPVG
tara:strand:- start:611 stop:721 length:111 start_codon:yes stop_codon:yes gene_type:complete